MFMNTEEEKKKETVNYYDMIREIAGEDKKFECLLQSYLNTE
jgi:hypothetical protein